MSVVLVNNVALVTRINKTFVLVAGLSVNKIFTLTYVNFQKPVK